MKLRAASERGAASETQKEGLPVKLTIGAASETQGLPVKKGPPENKLRKRGCQ